MMTGLADQTAAQLLACTSGVTRQRRLVEVDELECAVAWADLHPGEVGEQGIGPGGEGTPYFLEACVGEFALARATGVGAALNAIADGLDLRHRLPRMWQAMQSGAVDAWVPRRVAKMARHLAEGVVWVVDVAIAPMLGRESAGRVLEVAEAKIIEADPEGHQAAVEAAKKSRFVRAGRSNEYGLRTLIARIDAGDAVWLEATIARTAGILAGVHQELSANEVRAKAFGLLARPGELLQLLLTHLEPGDELLAGLHLAHAHDHYDDGNDNTACGDGDTATRPAADGAGSAEGDGAGSAEGDGAGSAESDSAGSAEGDSAGSVEGDHARDPSNDGASPDAASNGGVRSEGGSDEADSAAGANSGGVRSRGGNGDGGGDHVDDEAASSGPVGRAAAGDSSAQGPTAEGDADSPAASDTARKGSGASSPVTDAASGDPTDHDAPADEDAPPPPPDPAEQGPGLNRALAFPADLLDVLREVDWKKLTPQVVCYVHLHQSALSGEKAVARVEGLGPATLAQLKDLLPDGAQVQVKPVIDLNQRLRATAYEHPTRLKEIVHLITGGDYWPWATSTSRNVDYDHVRPYQKGGPPGQTGTHNSGPLGRRHHRWKTHAGYRARQCGTGRYVWKTPNGLAFEVNHHGTRPIDPDHAEIIINAPPDLDIYLPDTTIDIDLA